MLFRLASLQLASNRCITLFRFIAFPFAFASANCHHSTHELQFATGSPTILATLLIMAQGTNRKAVSISRPHPYYYILYTSTPIIAFMEPDKTYNVWARTIPDWAVVDDPLDIDCNDRSNPGLRAGPYAPAYYAGDLFRDDIHRLERLAEGIITRHVDYNRKSPALLFALLCIHTHWVFGPPSSAHSFIPQFIHLDIYISLSLMIYCGCFN